MPVAIQINHISDAGDVLSVRGQLTVNGNYTAGAGAGELIDFGAATTTMAKLAIGQAKGVPATEPPINACFWQRVGSGATPAYLPGAGPSNGRLRFWTANNTELTGAPTAYPAAMLAEIYDFEFSFRKYA